MRFGTSLEVSISSHLLFFPLTRFLVQQIAVEERGILHRDCSLNNAMIEDDGDGSHGTLIDWEFAVHILAGQKYAIGGTVSTNLPMYTQYADMDY